MRPAGTIVDSALIPGARPGPCWHYDVIPCRGTAMWPPPGWDGVASVTCTGNWETHTAEISSSPTSRSAPVEMTEDERRLLTELYVEDDHLAGVQ